MRIGQVQHHALECLETDARALGGPPKDRHGPWELGTQGKRNLYVVPTSPVVVRGVDDARPEANKRRTFETEAGHVDAR